MSTNQIRKDDIGTIFRGTICDQDGDVVDVSGATTKQLHILRLDATSLEEDASFYTDGTDGILQYTTVDGDINICGVYKLQWYVVLPAGSWKTNIVTFKVHDNLT